MVSRPDIGLWAVADGAGGHASGEVASGMLADSLNAMPAGIAAPALLEAIKSRVSGVHAALKQEAERRGHGGIIASTIVVLVIDVHKYWCLWAGDSRGYRLRNGVLTQITRDHSLVQELVDAGAIRPEQAESHPQANVITRAVGSDEPELDLETISGPIQPGDDFLLCSDGLCKSLQNAEMAALMRQGGDGSEGLSSEGGPAAALIAAALQHAARDNVTAVVVQTAPPGAA